MSKDVEIIEVDTKTIEISDEEDYQTIVIDDDEVEEIIHDTIKNELLCDVSSLQRNVSSSENSISLECNAAEPVVENTCNIEVKPQINLNNDYPQNESYSTSSMNNTVKSEHRPSNNRKRKRKRLRRRNNLLEAVSKEIESNNLNYNQINSSANCFEATSRAIASNTSISASFNFSKLKWLKPLNNLSSPPHLQMVIIDRGHPDWRIENEKWLMVEKRLLEALNTEMIRTHDPSIGLFDGAKWQRGIKIIGCHNENAFDFIMKFLLNLDKLWNGANLDAFPITNISRHIVKAYIPPPSVKTDVIMSLIKLQNPSLYCNDWKVVRERERTCNGGVDLWLSVNDQSFMQLNRVRGEIKFGINRIFLNPTR